MRPPPRRGDPRPIPPDTAGFTLVELMVALVLFGAVLGAAVSVVLNAQRSWTGSRRQMVTGQNESTGLEMLTHDVRMAGSGFGGRPIITGGVPGNTIYPLDPRPGTASDDTVVITGNFTGVGSSLAVALRTPSDLLAVNDPAAFQIGDLIVVTDGSQADMFQVTAVNTATGELEHSTSSAFNNPSGHVIWPASGYFPGDTVVRVERATWWVDRTGAAPRLKRQAGGGAAITVAEGISALRVLYRLADGTTTPSPGDPSLVRSVVIRYLALRPHLDGMGPSDVPDTLDVAIQPRVLG